MAIINPENHEALLAKGYNPFTILFSWEYDADITATQKMRDLHLQLEEKGVEMGQGWYLTGNRTMLVLGYIKSNIELQEISLSVTYDTPIQAEIYHAINIHDLESVVPK